MCEIYGVYGLMASELGLGRVCLGFSALLGELLAGRASVFLGVSTYSFLKLLEAIDIGQASPY